MQVSRHLQTLLLGIKDKLCILDRECNVSVRLLVDLLTCLCNLAELRRKLYRV